MKNIEESIVEAQASSKNANMSATKARRIINKIRGCSYEQALLLLEFLPHRTCYPILQLIVSAAANANSRIGSSKSNLFVSEARVDGSTNLKRFRPRARGRGYPIKKPTCHVIIKLREKAAIGSSDSTKDKETFQKS
uniref:ribosomal protein L22 n=1 Tax=Diplopterygium chinense TaxID=397680 RepID=UPI00202966DE|nr:ribosomal protein L22 [Diplopterygium chinense]QYC93004.1 ribosomal protein L22 [Diplopterygium chinense]